MTNNEAQTLEDTLKEEGFLLSLFNDNIDCWPISNIEDCVSWSVLDTSRSRKKISYEGKIPKRKALTVEYIVNRINQADKIKSINYSNLFKEKIGIDLNGFNIYATSYGVGIAVLYNSRRDDDIKRISDFLTSNNIEFKNEFSAAHWVYRFKISQARENIDKLYRLTQ